MGVDSSYGSGAVRSASNSASRANATRAAANRKKTVKATSAKVAAKKAAAGFNVKDTAQEWSFNLGGFKILGVMKGSVQSQQARTVAQYGGTRPIGQLVRDVTGVGYDSKGKFGVDPVGLAMAWTPAKFLKMGRLRDGLRAGAEAAETTGRTLIGSGAGFRFGTVTRRLDQGAQSVTRTPYGAYEAVSDRISAAAFGKDISRIMAQNKMRSVANDVAAAGRGGRDVYLPPARSTPASYGAQRVASIGREPGSLYPSGNPAGGYVVSPNLRQRRPVAPEWTNAGQQHFTPMSQAQRDAASRIGPLLDEADTYRKLSAGMKQGGEYYFPRSYQPYNFSRPITARGGGRLDPAMYQSEVMDFIRSNARDRKFLK